MLGAIGTILHGILDMSLICFVNLKLPTFLEKHFSIAVYASS